MSAGDFLGYGVLMLMGFGPLWFAWTTRRRWLRVLLALFAMLFLGFCSMAFVMGSSADSLQGSSIALVMLISGGICGLSAIGALILALTPAADRREAS